MYVSYQVALTVQFNLLVVSLLMKAEWRFASMECGELCVMTAGVAQMPELSAEV